MEILKSILFWICRKIFLLILLNIVILQLLKTNPMMATILMILIVYYIVEFQIFGWIHKFKK